MRAPSGRAPFRYLPESVPIASGEKASSPHCSRIATSASPTSNMRFIR
jgi:hypothetical protein